MFRFVNLSDRIICMHFSICSILKICAEKDNKDEVFARKLQRRGWPMRTDTPCIMNSSAWLGRRAQ